MTQPALTWIKYGHDYVTPDRAWHLSRQRIVNIGTWWIVYDHRGGEVRYAGQTKTIKEAKAWAEIQLAEVRA